MKPLLSSTALTLLLLAGTVPVAMGRDSMGQETFAQQTLAQQTLAQKEAAGPLQGPDPIRFGLPAPLDITGSVNTRPSSYLRIAPAATDQADVMVPMFKRIAADSRQLRFDGEMGINDMPVYVRPDQISEPARLRLRYISAVSVMPEASRMIVSINDRQIAEIMLDATAEGNTAEVDVPVGLLQAGYNVVRFAVQQRHRVDCSIEAANELWTQVDAAATGLALTSTNDQVSGVEELMGFPEGEDGATAITVVLPQGADLGAIDRSLRAAQALAIRADMQKPKIVFTRELPTGNGIQLFVGNRAQLRGLGLDEGTIGDGGLHVIGRSSGQVRVVLSAEKPEAIETAIFRLAQEGRDKAAKGSPSGLRALAFQRGTALSATQEISLASQGLATQEFSGRVFRTSFNVVTPQDFYPADNGKATLYLDGEYVGGLLTSNEALVRVNGRVVGASRLTRSGGETITRRAIELSLRTFNPGYNRVTLEIRAATEEDKDCNPLSLIESSRRLTVQATTALSLPKFARAEHMPNMAATAATGYPFADADKTLTLFMPKPDMAALSAAGTFITRTAVAGGKLINTRVSLRAPDEQTGRAMVVGAFADLPDHVLQHFDVKADMLPATWLANRGMRAGPSPAKTSDASATPSPAVRVASLASPTVSDAAAPQKDALDALAAGLKPEPEKIETVDRWLGNISRFLQRNIGYRPEQLTFLNRGRALLTAAPTTTLLVAEAEAKGRGNQPWILLTGKDSATLQRDTTELVSPTYWQQLGGRMATYDPQSSDLMVVAASDHYHVRMTERSMSNVTLFAAGWLSNHIHYYILVLLSACLVFGIFSRKLLNRVGQKP